MGLEDRLFEPDAIELELDGDSGYQRMDDTTSAGRPRTWLTVLATVALVGMVVGVVVGVVGISGVASGSSGSPDKPSLAVGAASASPALQTYTMKGDLRIEKYDDCAVEWPRFKQTHNKTYLNEEHDARCATFCKNLAKIQAHNAEAHAGNWSFSLGLNGLSDMNSEEMGGLVNAKALDHTDPAINIPEDHERRGAATKKSVDFRSRMPPVRDQGICGSCWTFSAVDVIDFQLNASQSNQQILDCMPTNTPPPSQNMRCSGGVPYYALQYLKKAGSVSYASAPYLQYPQPSCPENTVKRTAKVSNVKFSKTGEAYLLSAATTQAVSVTIQGGNAFRFQHYKFGTYDVSCGANTMYHAIAVVGYGTNRFHLPFQAPDDYWILRNSWGTGWGDGGYMYMKRGVNLCEIGTTGVVTADAHAV